MTPRISPRLLAKASGWHLRLNLRIACTALVLALQTGCSTNEADRAFFQDGWRHPEEGAERRMNSSEW